MAEFRNHLSILAESCKAVVEQMTRLKVETINVEKAKEQTEKLPYAHMIAYTDLDEKVDGNFILALQNIDAALQLSSAIAERLGLEKFVEVCDDSTDLLNEFLNIVVGRTISEWDKIGLSVKFEAPVFKKNHECDNSKLSQAHLIIMDLLVDGAVCQIGLRVDFSTKINNKIKNKKILLVEDSNVMRSIIGRILVTEGAILNEACDGEEAIALYKSFCPDLTIMDINMPNMGGFESIAHIQKFHPDAKFLILSSSSRKDEIISAKNLNVLGYIVKPVEPEQLIRRVSEVF